MGKPNNFKKVKNFILNNSKFKDIFQYNLMTKDIEFVRDLGKDFWHHEKSLIDEDIIHIKDYISEITDEEHTNTRVEEALLVISKRKAYHPLRDYLNSLKWDGVERLDYWLHHAVECDQNSYVSDAGRKVLCGAVARIFEPGTKFDYMMILEGDQGLGKSTMLEALGKEWYLDTHLQTDKKDMIDIMRTAWIMEIADLAGFSKADIQHLRSFITRKKDRVRLSYDKRSKDFKRQCIMIGTHNPSGDNQYFRDDTGNRRYWPVECKKVNVMWVVENRDQLFAEAVVKWRMGEELYINNTESLEILAEMQRRRQIANPWDEVISKYIRGKSSVTSTDIIEKAFCMNISAASMRDIRSKQTAIGIYMKREKWTKEGERYVNPAYNNINVEQQEEVEWDV